MNRYTELYYNGPDIAWVWQAPYTSLVPKGWLIMFATDVI